MSASHAADEKDQHDKRDAKGGAHAEHPFPRGRTHHTANLGHRLSTSFGLAGRAFALPHLADLSFGLFR